MGRWDEASELYRRGGSLSGRGRRRCHTWRARRTTRARSSPTKGKLEEAEHLFTEALRVWRAAGYPVGIALARSNLGRVAARAGRFDEALRLFEEALAFRALGSEAFVQETEARRAECLVLAGRFQEALEIVPRGIEAVEGTPQLGAFLERLYGYALVQARRADEARPHFERSIELARGLEAEYEVALTLEALARTRLGAPEADAESKEMLARLGVLATPLVPLP